MNLSDQSRAPIFEALERYKSMRIVPFDSTGTQKRKRKSGIDKIFG